MTKKKTTKKTIKKAEPKPKPKPKQAMIIAQRIKACSEDFDDEPVTEPWTGDISYKPDYEDGDEPTEEDTR
jgi:hypothetical protein